MDTSTALYLLQDGLVYGSIYALLALGLVLAFSVTRIIFIPIGEFVSWGALTLAVIQTGHPPSVLWLLLGGCFFVVLKRLYRHFFQQESIAWQKTLLAYVVYPALLTLALQYLPLSELPMILQMLLALLILVPIGAILWDIAYAPVAHASPLVLLIVSIAAHFILVGIGLICFGPEGMSLPAFMEGFLEVSALNLLISYQSLAVLGTTAILILILFIFFKRTMFGKALRATAMNRAGAQLMGIPTQMVGSLTIMVGTGLGAFVGILIGSIVTLSYDAGFIIGLKGFIGAIVGGLFSYPVAALGAVSVGLLEVFAGFFHSNYKDVIVFTMIIPVLLWRSMRSTHIEEE